MLLSEFPSASALRPQIFIVLFMSSEHVAVMNQLLAGSAEVREVSAKLLGEVVLQYELTDGPGGEIVY